MYTYLYVCTCCECCTVLQCVAVYCSVLQYETVPANPSPASQPVYTRLTASTSAIPVDAWVSFDLLMACFAEIPGDWSEVDVLFAVLCVAVLCVWLACLVGSLQLSLSVACDVR